MKHWNLSVCGCCLVDHLYPNIDFGSPVMKRLLSRKNGDGGIAPGKLVFAEDLQTFAGIDFDALLEEITGDPSAGIENIGGPAIVGAVNVSQILYNKPVTVHFYGACGNDEAGAFVRSMIGQTDVDMTNFREYPGGTPCTSVLSDPRANGGKGERTFLNRIGAAAAMTPDSLGDSFFAGDILWFSATALVPGLHDALGELLRRGRREGKLNIVSTVFDFRNEKKNPNAPWPLGYPDSWKDMDLLIVDADEAMRLSGKGSLEEACDFFTKSGVSSFFVTHGAKVFHAWSDGRLFLPSSRVYDLPVSALVGKDMEEHPEKIGDTTGCGDNFAGGIVASLILQLEAGRKPGSFSLLEAAAWGAASGGAACFQIGGTHIEKARGEKYKILARYADAYAKETAGFKL